MLFYDAKEQFVLRGRGTVRDDDLERNTEYVRDLVAAEPPSPKKAGPTRSSSVLDSRVGRFLFGWYALRVIIEVDPVAVEPVGSSTGELPSWPARGVDAGEADAYDRVVVATVDEDGWPDPRPVTGVAVDGDAALLETNGPVADGQSARLLGPLAHAGAGETRPAALPGALSAGRRPGRI